MSLIRKMKNGTGMTECDRDICRYILEHPEKMERISARELGRITFTSAASVTRFCQKLSLKGFPEFKLKFISELRSGPVEAENIKISMSEHENAVTMARKVTRIQQQAVEETKKEISYSQLVRIGRMIAEADSVDFYAYDINVSLAEYAASLFFHAGKQACVYSATNIQGLRALMPPTGHVSILISHTGENRRLMEVAKLLRNQNAKVIVIASSRIRSLTQYADEFLYAEGSEKVEEFWNAMFFASGKYLLDILYGMEFSRRYSENLKLNQQYEKCGKEILWDLINDV